MAIKKLCENNLLIDFVNDNYVCNNQKLITKYQKLPVRIDNSIFNKILLRKKKI